MVIHTTGVFLKNFRLGLLVPATFFALSTAVSPALAQSQSVRPPVSFQPVPSELELSKLIWSTMAAVDHANLSGNYSVLRDIAAPGFQENNNASQLAEVFASIRTSRLDLSNALLLAPTYTAAPNIVEPGVLRVQGFFGLRPSAIVFDFYYQWIGGKWKLFGVSITPRNIASMQPETIVPKAR